MQENIDLKNAKKEKLTFKGLQKKQTELMAFNYSPNAATWF